MLFELLIVCLLYPEYLHVCGVFAVFAVCAVFAVFVTWMTHPPRVKSA